MGLLDTVLGALNNNQTGAGATGSSDPKAILIQTVVTMIASNQSGGLSGLLNNLQNAGLGHLVDSWVGNGQNHPISNEQVEQTLGSDQLNQMAQTAGVSKDDAATHLASILPEIINHLTPNGQVPSSGEVSAIDLLQKVGGLLGGSKQA